MNRGNAELYGDSTTIRPNMHVGDRDLNEVDDTMVEVRRNWSVMLQENVR